MKSGIGRLLPGTGMYRPGPLIFCPTVLAPSVQPHLAKMSVSSSLYGFGVAASRSRSLRRGHGPFTGQSRSFRRVVLLCGSSGLGSESTSDEVNFCLSKVTGRRDTIYGASISFMTLLLFPKQAEGAICSKGMAQASPQSVLE